MTVYPKLVALALYILPALSAPSPLLRISKARSPVHGKYIVTLSPGQGERNRDDVNPEAFSNSLSSVSNITHWWEHMSAFAGHFSDDDLDILRADPRVDAIEEDGVVRTLVSVTQSNAPWGLSRISSQKKLAAQDDTSLSFTYTFDSMAGAGSTVYILDSGIFTEHPEFQGRAKFGASFVGDPTEDRHGHGTHCAGTAISSQFGVAKGANAIAVKVIDDNGDGKVSDLISGLNFIAADSNHTGNPSVASISIGCDTSDALDSAVLSLIQNGIPVVVAAGNENQDALNTSPARVKEAITVGASDIGDTRASFSNFGHVVDVWAPGVNVISTFNDGGTETFSGTSMATPHVSGLVAYLLGFDPSLSPAQVETTIKDMALVGVLSGIPRGTSNLLVNNGF